MNMKVCALMLAAWLPGLAAAAATPKGQGSGNPAAPILIELYSDFECPSCRQFHMEFLPLLMRDYITTGKVYLVQHDLSFHAHSAEATAYAFAAARIGKYTDVANALFLHQPEWSASGKVWDVVAALLSPAEQKKVAAIAKEPAVVAEVKNETDSGRAKIQKTPTMLVIRGMKQIPFEGAPNWDIFSGWLNELLTK
jgi:protein-disulfide isomerase